MILYAADFSAEGNPWRLSRTLLKSLEIDGNFAVHRAASANTFLLKSSYFGTEMPGDLHSLLRGL